MGRDSRKKYVDDTRAEYVRIATTHARAQEDKKRLSLKDARGNALKLDWASYAPPAPSFLGSRVIDDISIAELIDYIDWSPFFTTWELAGKFPAILDDKIVGEAARSLYDDAQKMLKEIVDKGWFKAAAAASASGRRIPRATTSRCSATRRAASRSRRCTRCASSSRGARAAPMWRSPISSRRRAAPITSAPSW